MESVGSVDAFPVGSRRLIQIGAKPVLVMHLKDGFVAFEDYCPHRAGPLSEGTFTDATVTCPWHAACFDLRTGANTKNPRLSGLRLRQTRVENNELYIQSS